MKTKIAVFTVIAMVLVNMSSARSLSEQEPAQDVLKTLLVEVRALRIAMEQTASAGARVQLVMGRLQLQEQRVNTLVRRLDELRQSRVAMEREASSYQDQLSRLEESLTKISDLVERQAVEYKARGLKETLVRTAATLERVRSEEADFAVFVTAEQRRWTDVNQQLEDLDRTLRRQ